MQGKAQTPIHKQPRVDMLGMLRAAHSENEKWKLRQTLDVPSPIGLHVNIAPLPTNDIPTRFDLDANTLYFNKQGEVYFDNSSPDAYSENNLIRLPKTQPSFFEKVGNSYDSANDYLRGNQLMDYHQLNGNFFNDALAVVSNTIRLPINVTGWALGGVDDGLCALDKHRIIPYAYSMKLTGGIGEYAAAGRVLSQTATYSKAATATFVNKSKNAFHRAKVKYNYDYRHHLTGKTTLKTDQVFYSYKNSNYFDSSTSFQPLELWFTPELMSSEYAVSKLSLPFDSGYDTIMRISLPKGTTIMEPRTVWSLFGKRGGGTEVRSYDEILSSQYTTHKMSELVPNNSVLRETGARRVLDPVSLDAWDAVEGKYDLIRANTTDVGKIAENIGWSESRVARIKEHVFFKEHQLDSGLQRFDADPDMFNAWNRLETGDFVKSDIDLLRHEIFESKFEGIFKTNYRTAHDRTIDSGRTWTPE